MRASRGLLLAAALAAAGPAALAAQDPAADSLATVRVTVRHDDAPVAGALVRALGLPRPVGAQTDGRGEATLRLPPGARAIVAGRLGFDPDTVRLTLRAGMDTAVVATLEERGEELESIVVTATRGERRVEDTPLRVEVIDEEEIGEKVAMTPGDVAMMLNETSGLRVQTTNPSLGGASVRIQGLRGRYSLLLADGLPLHGQAGGLGLLQIPPVDLGRVEVIKGVASALYGSSALGGVVNLVSRRPGAEPARTALLNQTSRGGTDAVFFGAGPLSPRWGWTLLAGAHRQARRDLDDDGWTDLAGYERAVVRPRLYLDDGAGRTAFLTGGFTAEDREGGTIGEATVPGGGSFVEGLRTRRADVGVLARWVLGDAAADDGEGALAGAILTVRGSGVEQRHRHRFGDAREDDRHRTVFAEAALAVPRGRLTWVAGAAFNRESYEAEDVAGFDYAHAVPAAFAQVDADPASWLSLSASARLDAHSEYGAAVSPRVSLLLRRPVGGTAAALAGWTSRLSAGTGVSGPTPFTDETEAAGLAYVVPPAYGGEGGLVAERARSASLDIGGPVRTPLGPLEVNATVFGSRIARPLQTREAPPAAPGDVARLALANAALATLTWGADAFARLRVLDVLDGEVGVLGTYVYLRSREEDPEAGGRREVPLTPRHAAGLDLIWEREERGRIGLEFFYTGRQSLDDNPYRDESRPYLLVGLLGEWRPAWLPGARLFANGENLTGVRQTRWDPLLLPARGPGGRWTTDAWTETAGATINAGVRYEF